MFARKKLSRRFIYTSLLLLLLGYPLFRFSNEIKTVFNKSSAQEKQMVESLSANATLTADLTSQLVGRIPMIFKKEIAQKRKEKLKQFMRENPHEALKLSLGGLRDKFEPEVREFIEEEVILDGSLEILHADDLDKKIATFIYYFKSNNKQYVLHLSKPMDHLKYGTRIRIKGMRLDDNIAVDNRHVANFEIITKVEGITTSKVKKVAYVLVSFQNTPSIPYTPDQAREVAFTRDHSVKNYFYEASFDSWKMQGHSSVDGDVVGWYTVPYDNTNCNSMFGAWTTAAEQKVSADGINLENYEKVVIAFNNAQGCPGSGWTYIGHSKAWIAGGFEFRTIVHELGHTYGLHHATARVCFDSNNNRVSLSTKCTDYEYGDPYDTMGSSTQNHFNNFNKGTIGWYEPSNTQTITQSGTYSVAPLGPNTTNVQALRVPVDPSSPGGPFYYVEYRQPYRYFDNFVSNSYVVNGVSIRVGNNYGGTKTHLLDMTPNGSFFDSSLTVGNTFMDDMNGTQITLNSLSPSEANISVTLLPPQCVRRAPEASVSPLNAGGYAGEGVFYQVFVKNIDSSACGESQFTFYSTVPSGWQHDPWSQTISLNPGAAYGIALSVISPSSATPGIYTLTQEVMHRADFSLITRTSANYTVLDNATLTPTPTSSPTLSPTLSPTPTPPGDITPPTVKITNPSNGAIVSRKTTVAIIADASDNTIVSKVEFYVNNSLLCTDTTSPFSCNWTVPNQGSVQYALTAKAFDSKANTASHSINVKSSSCLLICL